MRFTQKTDYAFRVMRQLTLIPKGKVIPVHKIADAEGLSVRFLQGVVRELVVRGLVRSVAGPTGGVMVARDFNSITFKDVVEAVEGPIFLMGCLEDQASCENSPDCKVHKILGKAQFAMYQVLERYTLQELFEKKPEGPIEQVDVGW